MNKNDETLPGGGAAARNEAGARGAVFTVGLVINMAVRPSRDIMVAMLRLVNSRSDLAVKIFHGSPATTVGNIEKFITPDIDGIVICGFNRALVMDFLLRVRSRPPVVLGSYCPVPKEDADGIRRGGVVEIDNDSIARKVAEYYHGHALQNFAFLGSNIYREFVSSEMRSQAFKARLSELCGNNIRFSALMLGCGMENDDFWNSGREAVEAWLRGLSFPCGIFINGEIEALYLVKVLSEIGIDVPGEVELLCVDNGYGLCEQAHPALSSIEIDFGALALLSVDMLRAWRDDPLSAPAVAYVSEGCLHERDSSASGRGYGRVAARAREYIRTNALRNIDVGKVAAAIGVSRRTLELRVRESLGRSVLSLIHEVRLEEVCRLLATTEKPVMDVAMDTGFNSVGSLAQLFKKTYGMSMRQYRRAKGVLDN